MKTLKTHIQTENASLFETFAAYSKEIIKDNGYETRLTYKEQIGSIDLKSIQLNDFMSFSFYNFKFNEDTSLDAIIDKQKGLFFLYALEGEIKYSLLYSETETNRLQEFQTGMLLINERECFRMHFKKGVSYSFFGINMHDTRYLKEKYKEQNFSLKEYRAFFNFLNTNKNNIYSGSFNLRIADYIRQLQNTSGDRISSPLFLEGIVYIIVALKIKQFTEDKMETADRIGILTKKECQEVKRLSDLIMENPEKAFSIEYLCAESTLSPFKIQEGFKRMHGRTVADFIRNVRVEKAEELINTTDLNISEIVYSIGFTSRSYFAKIFKKKYNCSPKTYQNNKRKLAVTA